MDVRYLKKLIKVVEESEISELEIEDQGGRVKIVKHQPGGPAMVHMPVMACFRPTRVLLLAAAGGESRVKLAPPAKRRT